jgi:hypothetical protein
VLGRAVHREPIPQPVAGRGTKTLNDRLARVRTQIVHHQMNGIGLRVARRHIQQVIGELGRGAVARHLSEMPPRLGLDAAENVGRSAAPIFGIPTGYSSRLHRHWRPDFLMKHHRFLVDTHHRFPDRERLFIDGQHSSMRAMYSSSAASLDRSGRVVAVSTGLVTLGNGLGPSLSANLSGIFGPPFVGVFVLALNGVALGFYCAAKLRGAKGPQTFVSNS